MTDYRLSAVMPVCNNERFVAEAVESMLRQSLKPFEFVVGDDGSSDGTSAILAEMASRNPLLRVIRRERRSGLANAANWVVEAARGEFIALAHADDVSFPDRLADQMAAMRNNPEAVLVGAPAVGIDDAGREVHPANLWRILRPSAFAPFAHSSIVFRKDAFLAAGGYRPEADYWEDLDLFWRMAALGPLLTLTKPVTAYRYSEDSFRSRDAQAKIELAVHRMYEKADAVSASTTRCQVASEEEDRSIDPRVFIARSWNGVWRGKRPHTWRRLLQRARLRPDIRTFTTIAFIASATLAPRPLRWVLSTVARVRNSWVRQRLKEGAREWRPIPHSGHVAVDGKKPSAYV